jgi:hypothetical protein
MRQTKNLYGIAAVMLAILVLMAGLPLTGCSDASGNNPDGKDGVTISISAIGGVTAVAGATPVTSITPSDEFTGTVKWNGNPETFAANTEYTATITLKAKPGYTLTGVAANFFKVANATSGKNEANSGVVTAVFRTSRVPNPTPVAEDFDIGNLSQSVGSVSAVSIKPKEDKSTGAILIFYNNSITLPTTAGNYDVTFNVAQANGWNAASGLSAGTLALAMGNPAVPDFNIPQLVPIAYDGNEKTITITPKTGKSTGTITVKYNGDTAAPSAVGTYTVTFDIGEEPRKWNAASGLSAGTLVIIPATPDEENYTITGLAHTFDGQPAVVKIERQEDMSTGAVTVYYEGTDGTSYAKSTTAPSAAGSYEVTFDVAAVPPNWNGASGLPAGTLAIGIGYTVTQVGGVSGISTTTAIQFTFEYSIDGVTAADVNISGVAKKESNTEFSGSGKNWTLSPIKVSSTGIANITIKKTGIDAQRKTVPDVFAAGKAGISISVNQITDPADDIDIDIPELHRFNGLSETTLTLDNAEQYDYNSIRWRVNGVEIGTGDSVTLNAKDSRYSTFGKHYLTVSVTIDGKFYNKNIPFTVQY